MTNLGKIAEIMGQNIKKEKSNKRTGTANIAA